MAVALLEQEKENNFLCGRIQVLKKKHTNDFRHGGRGSLSTRPATRPKMSNQEAAQARKQRAAKNKVTSEVLAIKRVPPNKYEPAERTFGPGDHHSFGKARTYHWCPHHVMWCIHKPEECTGRKESEKKNNNERAGEDSNERESI